MLSPDWPPGPPPTKLSADPKSPWYNDAWVRTCEVLLNGEAQRYVVTVNADEGWLEKLRYPLESVGDRPTVTELAIDRLFGSVEIRRKRP